ncbi:MAG TPA: ABC transporter ATP-binding protein [Spirochaetia bacterium]|nr:ABC transporter ATP-binding protein [Spirochaetia bacterium]
MADGQIAAEGRTVSPSGDVVLAVRDLMVTFPTAGGPLRAVRGAGYTLRRGECLGIVGESGSGKSVSAAAVLGLLSKDARVEGSVQVGGREVLTMEQKELQAMRGSVVSMIFQEPSRSFDPIYSIGKTFEETFRAKDRTVTPEESRKRAVQLLSEVHIPRAEERLKNFPHQFSGGMLQRIMIALALSNNPEILIADEPTTALDVTIQAQIAALLRELQRSRQLSLIFISHDLGLVGQVADRILVMYGGIVLEVGPTRDVLTTPHSPYTRALLRALPAWGSHYTREELYTIRGNVPDPTRPEPGCPFAPRCALVREECRQAIPPLRASRAEDGERTYRCVVEGAKA